MCNYRFPNKHESEIMIHDLNEIAMQIVLDFRNGHRFWNDHKIEVTFPKGYLAKQFREWIVNQCDGERSLQEALEFSEIYWPLNRVKEIEAGMIEPSPAELHQWCNTDPDLCDPVGLITYPLERDGKVLGWALIENSGFFLDPDIKLLGIFTNIEKIQEFITANFDG